MANRMKGKGCSRKTPVLTLLSEAGHLKITIAIKEDKYPIFYEHFRVSKMSVFKPNIHSTWVAETIHSRGG